MTSIKAHLKNEAVWRISTWAVKAFLRTTITDSKPVGMTEEGWGMLLRLYINFDFASSEEIRRAAQVCEDCSNKHGDAIGGTALGLYVEAERRETKN